MIVILFKEALCRTHTLQMQKQPLFRKGSNQRIKSTLQIPFTQELQEDSPITTIKINLKYTCQ